MYTIIIPNSVGKALKRFDKGVLQKVIIELEALRIDPFRGTALSGNLAGLRRLKLKH